MKRLLLPLLAALALPTAVNAEIKIDKKNYEILKRGEEFIHKKCLKEKNYEFCRELDNKISLATVAWDFGKSKNMVFDLIGDICVAGQKGYLKKPRDEFILVLNLYKQIYKATAEEKELICNDNGCRRKDLINIIYWAYKNYPDCVSKR